MATDLHAAVHGVDRFHLEIDGISSAAFVRCRGLAARAEVLTVREGGRATPHLLRGRLEYAPIVLEAGITRSPELYRWFVEGDRRDGAILMLSAEGREVMRWSFVRGWPCAWNGPTFDATARAIAVERLEIAHEGLQWIDG